jgi:hypothetical protein
VSRGRCICICTSCIVYWHRTLNDHHALGSRVPEPLIILVKRLSAFAHCMSITGPPLWSSGQSSWLQIQRSGFDSRRYQIFWEVVGLEPCPLSLVSTIEELLGRKVAAPVKKAENTAVGMRNADCATPLYSQKLALTSLTGGSRSVGIVRSRTQAMEFCFMSITVTQLPYKPERLPPMLPMRSTGKKCKKIERCIQFIGLQAKINTN